MRARTRSQLLILALAAVLALPAGASAQGGSQAVCPATFEVLHDDTVGALYLPMGNYTVTLLDANALSCAEASDLLRQFLEDWDGRLPRPWVVNAGSSSFTRGAGGSVGFSLSPAGSSNGGGGGGHHPHGAACPGTFQVLHNDRIGTFAIPAGNYQITLLSIGRISCARASAYFARFLQDFDGILPRPWHLDPGTGSFVRGHRHVGFRIEPYVADGGTSNGSRHPVRGETRCPTFRVLHNDRIGRLILPRGTYNVWVRGRLSCSQSTTLFQQFLQDPSGNLPSPWVVNAQTGRFSRGPGSSTGFRVKLVR
jgi:hypothetical protein